MAAANSSSAASPRRAQFLGWGAAAVLRQVPAQLPRLKGEGNLGSSSFCTEGGGCVKFPFFLAPNVRMGSDCIYREKESWNPFP